MAVEQTNIRKKWADRISKRLKDFKEFHDSGETVVDTYRIEKRSYKQREKYNILYSNTETIRPSLYSQTAKVEVAEDSKDTNNPLGRVAGFILEAAVTYVAKEEKLDELMDSTIEDYLLPGMGLIWPRYDPHFKVRTVKGENGEETQQLDEDGGPIEDIEYEQVKWDYVFWKDILLGKSRRWEGMPWLARRVWMDKSACVSRFGKAKAEKINFNSAERNSKGQKEEIEEGKAEIWEIWDKLSRKVYWYCEGYPEDILDEKSDPLKLKGFYPCPRPMFAITTTNKIIPRPFFSQYQAQADELNDITLKIRRLVDALKVAGIYDSSMDQLANLLKATDNTMIPVEGWATVQDKGGIKGVVQFLPISEIATVLMQLYDARERVKQEIYEITGWSDIIRGSSKASETLGAQQIKADWAGARLKRQQKEVQRFIRDLFRITAEIISEHFTDASIASMCGIQYQDDNSEFVQLFGEVVKLLRNDRDRCTLVDVETDSTLLPDEARDRAERMEFLGAAGAFLQQAVPAAQQTPALGPLLGEMLMFSIRSFRAARPLEQAFEQFRNAIGQNPQQPGQSGEGESKEDSQAKLQTAMAGLQAKQEDTASKERLGTAELQQDAQEHADKMALENQREQNRHAEKMAELALREREVAVKERELGLDASRVGLDIRRQEFDESKPDPVDRGSE